MYQRDHIGRHHFEQANGDIVPDVCHQHTEDEPLLGLATTRQLLTEVAMRMEITQNSTGGRDLGRLCESAIEELDKGVLDYSTVHPSGNGFVISRMP
jgi:hypothetical protein